MLDIFGRSPFFCARAFECLGVGAVEDEMNYIGVLDSGERLFDRFFTLGLGFSLFVLMCPWWCLDALSGLERALKIARVVRNVNVFLIMREL